MMIADEGLNSYLTQLGRRPLLERPHELKLARAARAGSSRARWMLVEHNLRLVVSIAKTIARGYETTLPLVDLIQVGNLELVASVDAFDPERDVKLATYALPRIRSAILRAVRANVRPLRVPGQVFERIGALQRIEERIRLEAGRRATTGELVAAGFGEDEQRRLRSIAQRPATLDEVGCDQIADAGSGPEERLVASVASVTVARAIAELDERPAEVIRRRFGFAERGAETLEQIGSDLGISGERVRQLEERALKTLGRSLAASFAA